MTTLANNPHPSMTPSTVDELLDYWPGNIPFKGSLVSDDGSCMCAQGQALHFLSGMTVDELRSIDQAAADREVAELLGISVAHSILLRIVNDRQEGAPSSVIRSPEQVLGDQAQVVLAFWRHLDRMTPAAWAAAKAAGDAALDGAGAAAGAAAKAAVGDAAWVAAGVAARAAARAAAKAAAGAAAKAAVGDAAWVAAGVAAGAAAKAAAKVAAWGAAGATSEIQGASFMRANNQPFLFLPLFGFSDPEAVIAASV